MPEVGVQMSIVPAGWAYVSLQTSSSLPLETLKWLEFLKFAYGRCRSHSKPSKTRETSFKSADEVEAQIGADSLDRPR